MIISQWWHDLCTSITPVLGPKGGGEIMRNSPKYAAWWCVSRLNTMSESRRSKLAEQHKASSIVSEQLDPDGRLPSEKNCSDIGRSFGSLGTVTGCYSYTDEAGKELFQVLRFDPKSFRQRHRSFDGQWVWKNSVRNVLYRLPVVKAGIESGATLWITEGEEDAIELLSRGLIATTIPGGASEPGRKPKWMPEHTELLRGANKVNIWADNDKAGIEHATVIALSIRHVISSEPQVLVSERGKDAREHFANGGTLNNLKVVYGSMTEMDRYDVKEELDDTVSSFLHANPEFVPQTRAIRERLRGVRNPCEWEAELEAFAAGPQH